MDLCGYDACDKVKANRTHPIDLKQFQECKLEKKIVPLLPDGTYPDYQTLIFFKEEKDTKDKRNIQMLNQQIEGTKKQELKVT